MPSSLLHRWNHDERDIAQQRLSDKKAERRVSEEASRKMQSSDASAEDMYSDMYSRSRIPPHLPIESGGECDSDEDLKWALKESAAANKVSNVYPVVARRRTEVKDGDDIDILEELAKSAVGNNIPANRQKGQVRSNPVPPVSHRPTVEARTSGIGASRRRQPDPLAAAKISHSRSSAMEGMKSDRSKPTHSRDKHPTRVEVVDRTTSKASQDRVTGLLSRRRTDEGSRPDRHDPASQRPSRRIAALAPVGGELRPGPPPTTRHVESEVPLGDIISNPRSETGTKTSPFSVHDSDDDEMMAQAIALSLLDSTSPTLAAVGGVELGHSQYDRFHSASSRAPYDSDAMVSGDDHMLEDEDEMLARALRESLRDVAM